MNSSALFYKTIVFFVLLLFFLASFNSELFNTYENIYIFYKTQENH